MLVSCTQHAEQKSEIPPTQSPDTAITTKPAEYKAGELITQVIAAADPSQSYALYLPKNYDTISHLPAMIFFDPHGSGSYPVGLFRSLADEFGFILVGSNNSKNGITFEQTNLIASHLVSEVVNRYAANPGRISLAGFSGGAKAALMAAETNETLISVIYCGAAVPVTSFRRLPPALGFAGTKDMNYTEIISSAKTMDEMNFSHSIVSWNGKHEWPDSVTFSNAFYWSCFQAMKLNIIPVNKQQVNRFISSMEKKLAATKSLTATSGCLEQLISFIDGIADAGSYRAKLQSIQHSAAFRKEMANQNGMLQKEIKLKESYMQAFNEKDLRWWQDEVMRMNRVEGPEKEMYQRLLGYLSLAAYSYSNNSLKQNNFPAAGHFLAIYKLADPTNSEQPFLSACLYAKQGDQPNAIMSLKEAIRLGLKDKSKIEQEESFSSLRSNPEFSSLLNGL